MNLFQLNTSVDYRVLQSAEYDIRRYIDFINKAIDFLKEEQLPINITKQIVEVEIIKEGNRQRIKETRYIPQVPTNKKSEKAIDILFNENTKEIYAKKSFNREDGIRLLEQNEDENYFTLTREIESELIYLKPDLNQLQQQFYALRNLREKPLSEHIPLLELFGNPDSTFWNQRYFPKEYDWKILTEDDKDGVEEQREFVSKAMQTKDFALMEGPPGSGKTTTIIELIMQFTAEGKRVLLCSATHAAIDNVIERIKGRYKDICDKEIVPVRISRFEKPVKENVRPYLLKNICNKYREDIYKKLSKSKTPTPSQKLFKDSIRVENINIQKGTKYEPDSIDQLILDSANLVAGTMIGILQHPDIRANKQGASFDVLIVDEASKVTFSDFIVPALHAKKWILVGDVKQLSPYVENDYVSENIGTMLVASEQEAIVKQFELKLKLDDKRYDDLLKIYFTESNIENEFNNLSNDFDNLFFKKVTNSVSDKEALEVNGADVLVCMNSGKVKEFLSKNVIAKSIAINGSFKRELDFNHRQNYLHNKELPEFTSKGEDWSEMVSSRLNQSFSFRNAEGFENIDKELTYLIPNEIEEGINQIKRLVFPSILELLQNGIGKRKEYDRPTVMTTGFSDWHKESRFTSLTYQHRMHPDIAKTSRENFYENNLEPANTVLEDRGWKYALNEPAVKWIHDNDGTGNRKGERIINPTEAINIEKELAKFLAWAKDHPKPNGEKYEVAVLTFYLNQETELRRRIRRITKQGSFSKFQKDNTDIFLYTVDKFQGQEADLVLLGFTKCSPNAFYSSPNRLNVALTRARHKLYLFGNKPYLKKSKLNALRDLATNFQSTIRYEK